MKIYIAVVSHGHAKLLNELDCLPLLVKDSSIEVVLLDNLNEKQLKQWCASNSIVYHANPKIKGFGENNNIVFDLVVKLFDVQDDDFFIVLNPDVVIDIDTIHGVISTMQINRAEIGAINLFKDKQYEIYDNSIRKFPSLFDFMLSLLLGKNPSVVDKSKVIAPMFVDWAAGSFLCFKQSQYKKLRGFDIKYFMYCEDLDICYRSARLFDQKVLYCPDQKALHLAQHANRSVFSRHFLWHLNSVVRYLNKKWFGI